MLTHIQDAGMYRIKGFVAVKLASPGLQLLSLAALCSSESERETAALLL